MHRLYGSSWRYSSDHRMRPPIISQENGLRACSALILHSVYVHIVFFPFLIVKNILMGVLVTEFTVCCVTRNFKKSDAFLYMSSSCSIKCLSLNQVVSSLSRKTAEHLAIHCISL
jgi:hypothetical protein